MKIVTYINGEASTHEGFLTLNKLLAKKTNTPLILMGTHLHAYTPSMSPIIGQGYNIDGPAITEEERKKVESDLLNLKSKIDEFGVNINVDVIDYPFENYLKSADKKEVMLSTILRESESSFWNELFGTEETYFANKSSIPILIIPENARVKIPTKILFVISDPNKLEDLKGLWSLSEKLNVNIHYLINSNKYKESRTSYLKKLEFDMNIKFTDLTGKVSFYENDEEQEIEKISKIENPDWIGYQNVVYHGLLSSGKNFHKNHIILDTEKPILLV